jgi:hypothetical protein
MMNQEHGCCAAKEQELLLYHYRELDVERQRRMQSHLEKCGVCRQKLDDFVATLAIIPPQTMEWTGADQRRFSFRVNERINRRRAPAGLWAGGMAAAALMVVLLLPWRSNMPSELSSVPPSLPIMAELEMLERMDFLQTLDLLEVLDLLEELEPLG